MVDPNTRDEFTFSTASVGGVRACKRLIHAYVKQIDQGKGSLPVIVLESSPYQHPDRKRGTIYNPVFERIDWMRADALLPDKAPDKIETVETAKAALKAARKKVR
jgi:hypothetical protein